ncbi:tudor domain-containing protein 6 isoform X3 [Struthio camelus]|uniref:tudor domain-containing protein 6 isoform X3 n=1 Tax=Struthio camelus TaxID=8801 RepID=UPI0036040196
MCSVPGVPDRGATVSLRVCAVDAHPEAPVLRLWGLLGERREDYARLRRDLQAAVAPRLAAAPDPAGVAAGGAELCAGDLGLVELGGLWHRCRVVSRRGRDYRVFLLDEGRTVPAAARYLVRGCEELFHLPPEVLGCVVADLVLFGGGRAAACGEPLVSPWTVRAVEFLGYLHGKEVSGLVREVMMPQLLVVLELPQLVAQMHHLGLAKQVTPSWFCLMLKRCLAHAHLQNQPKLQPPGHPLVTSAVPQQLHIFPLYQPVSPALDYFYPQLQLGVTEPVLVTQISDPHHVYCQLQSLSQEIHRLSDTLYQLYDGSTWEQDFLPKLGSPCAARGIGGQWYRALLLEVVAGGQDQQVAQVIFVDYGRKEFVTATDLRRLPAECFRMPVVTYPCALQGISHGGHCWSPSQINELKVLLLGKGVNAHIEAFNSFEHLYYVSLYGEDGMNLNCLFGVQARCMASSLMQVRQTKAQVRLEVEEHTAEEQGSPPGAPPVALMQRHLASAPVVGVRLKWGAFYDAQISHLRDPSEFWLQLQEHHQLLSQLMQSMWNFYSQTTNLVDDTEHLQPGSLCASRKDNAFHRAVITRILDSAVEIYLMDRGAVETVDWCEVKELLPQFQEPPALALKCCLAGTSPVRGSWSEESVSAFRKIVLNKELRIRVLGTQGDKYVVEILDQSQLGEKSAQAFRCSLYNLIQPNGQDPFVWDEKAVLAFQEFIDASSCQLELKCTIFALASINNKELFNIVDLMTPFQSACQFLIERGLARPLSPQKPLASSVQLHSYYYSMHDIKIGSEEDVYITHVDDPWKFYCQLARCADVLAQLTENIGHLSKIVTSLKASQNSGSLCLARYTDNHWYRGVVTKTKPNKEIFFVDFGNTEMVKKEDLLPIPSGAYDVLLLPMQAIKCSLSDISAVPKDATMWFKQAVLERRLKAIVVAKESDGKLLIELFDGNTQINAKLKEGLRLTNSAEQCRHIENETLSPRNTDVKEKDETAEFLSLYAGKLLERKKWSPEAQGGEGSSKMRLKQKDINLFQTATKRELAAELLDSEKYSNTKDALLFNKVEDRDCFSSVKKDKPSYVKSDSESQRMPFKNISDLPQKNIVPALKVLVYVSHVNDPSDFYVQLVSDESQLNSISESLNSKTRVENPCGQLLQAGDLISAVYSEDSLWYRAVVKEKTSDNLISVHYIDYGNTSVINVDQVCRLPEDSSSIPAISIHCLLGGLKCKKTKDWAEKTMLYFSQRTSDVQITCEFVEKIEDQWEVILSDDQGVITVDLVNENLASRGSSHSTEVLDKIENNAEAVNVCEPLPPNERNEISNVSDSTSFLWKIPEAGQTVKIYVTVVKGPEYFWSQGANTENIKYIEEKIKEAENLGLSSTNDCRSLIKTGDICIAKYSEDGKFYRVKVSDMKGDNLVVRYVDYGTEETVSMEMVRQIPSELLRIPNQAFPCCLSGFNSSEGSWLSEAEDKFYDMTVELLLEAKVMETREDEGSEVPLSVVKLETCGKSINEEMKCFWKVNTGTGFPSFSNLENPLKENMGSSNNSDLCLEKETVATSRVLQEEDKSAVQGALLCSECLLDATSVRSNNVEANVSVEAVEEHMSVKADDECKTAEHQNNFDKDTPLSEKESDNEVSLEPTQCCSLCVLGSDMKAAEQELPEVPLVEDDELKADLIGIASAVNLLLENKQEELLGWPLFQVQPSLGDETASLLELEQLQMHSSYDDLKEFILELESLSVQSSVGEKTKEALELESLETQTTSGSEAQEKMLELVSLEVPLLNDETGEVIAMKSFEISLPLSERENLMSSVSDGEKTLELFPSDVQLSLGDKKQALELDLPGVHEAEAMQSDWMEVDPTLMLSSFGGGAEKQMELETHDIQSVLGAEIKQLLELVLPDVQPPQEDRDEDLLGLEHTALQTSANSRSLFSCLKTDLANQRPVCTVKLCDCNIEKCEEWQKKQDDHSVEEWMKQDLVDSFKECGSQLLNEQSLDCKPVGEEIEKKQNENLADCCAEHSEYTCNLKGFAIGSKCMVWTSLKWCEARILEVSEKGTRVLNLSSGSEETVDPENVWNGIPDWACRSSEAVAHATDNLESLREESVLQEKQTGCSSDLAEDPCVLQHS